MQLKISPEEFWNLPIEEFHVLFNSKVKEIENPTMTKEELEEMKTKLPREQGSDVGRKDKA